MKVVALATLAVVAVTFVTACGSAHRRVVYNESPDIYRTRNHRYSVGQVEAAFGRQGVHLHKLTTPVVHGFVFLRYGHLPHFVDVNVLTEQPGLSGPFGIAKPRRSASPLPKLTRHGNVIAIYDSGHAAAVRDALAELH